MFYDFNHLEYHRMRESELTGKAQEERMVDAAKRRNREHRPGLFLWLHAFHVSNEAARIARKAAWTEAMNEAWHPKAS